LARENLPQPSDQLPLRAAGEPVEVIVRLDQRLLDQIGAVELAAQRRIQPGLREKSQVITVRLEQLGHGARLSSHRDLDHHVRTFLSHVALSTED
jgi:hypothetical protein